MSVAYRDYVGNESVAYEDTIILDTLPPSGEIYTITESSPYAHSAGNTVYYGDDGSGQFQAQVQASDERSGLERDMTANGDDIEWRRASFGKSSLFVVILDPLLPSGLCAKNPGAGNHTGVPLTKVRDIISSSLISMVLKAVLR